MIYIGGRGRRHPEEGRIPLPGNPSTLADSSLPNSYLAAECSHSLSTGSLWIFTRQSCGRHRFHRLPGRGLDFTTANHASRFGRVCGQRNSHHVTLSGRHGFAIEQLTTKQPGAWQTLVSDVNDPGTLPVYGPLKVRGFGFIDSGCHLLVNLLVNLLSERRPEAAA